MDPRELFRETLRQRRAVARFDLQRGFRAKQPQARHAPNDAHVARVRALPHHRRARPVFQRRQPPRHIRFVEDKPVTVTGKPQKFIMRERMMRELGLSVMATA